MNNKMILISLFCVLCLIQISVPAKMIYDSDKVLEYGKSYKFKTAPIDPTDPFRGKYITLNYENNYFPIDNQDEWNVGQEVYVYFAEDSLGFAYIAAVSVDNPLDNKLSLKLKIDQVTKSLDPNRIYFRYPFDRLYLEESKATAAEDIYRKAITNGSDVYALVNIWDGKAVLNDVFVDDVRIVSQIK